MSMMQGQGPAAGPDIGALLGALGGGGAGAPDNSGGYQDQPDSSQTGGDPLSAVQQAIQDLHALETILPDPQDVANVKQCGLILAKIQGRMYQTQQTAGNAQQQLAQQLGGGS